MTNRGDTQASRSQKETRTSDRPSFTKTPTFAAHNADRYQRRQLVTDVQDLTAEN